MNKESCPTKRENDNNKFIINCAGEKVAVSSEGFTARCAIGNTDDYLKSFNKYVNPEIVSLGEPPLISVIIPSYATSKDDINKILISLCSQEYPVKAEILICINEPENAAKDVTIINDQNESFIRSLENATAKYNSSDLTKTKKLLLAAIDKSRGNIKLKCVRNIFSGGLAGVYQIVTVSLIARVRSFCDQKTDEYNREEKIKCIEHYLKNCMVLFCDDDMEIKNTKAISVAYEHAVNNNEIVLGRLYIDTVDSLEKYNNILRDLMQLFIDFKYDHELNFLTPRGMLLSNILRVGGVKIGEIFADQLFFASIAIGRKQYLMDANTSIAESDNPGNGKFLKKLRLYIEGENNDALKIFENVLSRYKEDKHVGKYCAADIERLITSLKTRDIHKISAIATELLVKS